MSPSQLAMCQWGWGFHTLRGDTAPGYPRTHPPVVGVVHVCKGFSSGDGNLSSPRYFGSIYDPQPVSDRPVGLRFHTVRGGLDPGDHHFRPHVVGVVKVWKNCFFEDETPSSSDAARPRRWPEGKILPHVGSMSSSQSSPNQLGWSFHAVPGSIDPADLSFRPRIFGRAEIYERISHPEIRPHYPRVRCDLGVGPRGDYHRALAT